MSISFEKHRSEIKAAWKDVLDDKSTTNWCLYGYEGQTNELKVMGSGEGGLEELSEELNSGKIMYAFVRFEENKTGLKKFLLINWQGEGAPVLRKGTCANHIHDVAKILSGAHLTVNARNEDDLDVERLLKKLMTTNSSFSFKEPRAVVEEQKTPIGTNYRRVIPTKELNASVMQDFWKREEEEEKTRLAVEKEEKRLQQVKLEKEQRTREEKEHLERENKLQQSNKLQSAHVPIKTSPQPLSPEKTIATNFQKALTEAERMRQQRSQEARELIGSRVLAAKAIFTKHTSEGQLKSKLNSAPPAKPARISITQRIHAFNQAPEEPTTITTLNEENNNPSTVTKVLKSYNEEKIKLSEPVAATNESLIQPTTVTTKSLLENHFNLVPVKPEITTAIANNEDDINIMDDYPLEPDAEQFSTIKRSPHSKTNSLQSPDEAATARHIETPLHEKHNHNTGDNDDDDDEQNEEEELRTKVSVTVQQSQSQVHTQTNKNGYSSSLERNEMQDLINEDDFICQDSLGDLGLRARALYDYQAADESEITFDPGDVITHIDQIDEGWWQGLGPDGTYGLFPANYVEIVH